MEIYQGWMCKTRQDLVLETESQPREGVAARYRHVYIDTPTQVTVCDVPESFLVPQFQSGTPLVQILAPAHDYMGFLPRDQVFATKDDAIRHMVKVLNDDRVALRERMIALRNQISQGE